MYTDNAWHYVPNADPSWTMEDIDRGLAKFSPLNRVGLPEDVSRVVAFLAGSESEWINGTYPAFPGCARILASRTDIGLAF